MKGFAKIVAALVLALFLLAGAGLAILRFAYPRIEPAPRLQIAASDTQVARGRYLANAVMACTACHSKRRRDRYSAPPRPDTFAGGGYRWGPEDGLPGTLISPNITPHGLANWSDGEILRAISSGVDRSGEPIFPIMPYTSYGTLDREDLIAVVAYLRTLVPVDQSPPRRRLDWPIDLFIRAIPKAPVFSKRPAATDRRATGAYLVRAAACTDCHTREENGLSVGEPFAGGNRYPIDGFGHVVSANITPDEETGIGSWNREQFIIRFKSLDRAAVARMPVAKGGANTVMPWWAYAGMTEQDLGAIYDFLMRQKPVLNDVAHFEPAD